MSQSPEYVLAPANRAFIAFSLVAAFLLNLPPWGRIDWMPDFVALVLVFWNIHQPRKVGIGIAFLFGLLMDVHEAGLLGEHALAYSLLSYGAISLHRRVPFFGIGGQMLHLIPLFYMAELTTILVRLLVGSSAPGWPHLLSAFTTTMLWPIAQAMLLAPQRRADQRDENRPL
ncbi:MAG: rod shape-determining protein MreD [Quisquiliibacterium sp.]